MRRHLTLATLLLVTGLTASNSTIDSIFLKICQALQLPGELRPRIELRNTINLGAAYSKVNHTIYVEKKLIDALSILKSQKNNALAFIIGHELCHAVEKDKHDTHFIAYDKYQDASFRNEQNADIQGAFVAHIAGYNCLPVLEETINLLYQTYNLHPDLKGYPNKVDRIESITQVREQVESLIAIFKAANLLMLADEYSLATGLFEKVFTYFPSPEVSNNMATTLMLEAMNLGKYNYFKYALPVEIDWNFRLKKPSLLPGQKEFEPEIIRKREFLFKKADIVYKNLLLRYPDYIPAWINLACLKMLKADLTGARGIINEAIKKKTSPEYKESLKMLRGTVYLMENNKSKASSEFKGIQDPWLKILIQQNLNPEASDKPAQENCNLTIPTNKKVLSPLLQEKTIQLDTISLTWNTEKYLIRSAVHRKEFTVVELNEQTIASCTAIKSFGQSTQKWNNSLISILNPIDKKRVYYAFR